MTASAPIVGALRGIPDAASASPLDGGVSAHPNFQSVLEQYQASSESLAEPDDSRDTTPRKSKDSDATATLSAPQPVTPAVEAPRLILPFSTSIALRQDTTSARDDAAIQDATSSPGDAATQDSTAAVDPKAAPSTIANTLPTPAILRSAPDLRSVPWISAPPMNYVAGEAQPRTQANLAAKAPAKSPDPVPMTATATKANQVAGEAQPKAQAILPAKSPAGTIDLAPTWADPTKANQIPAVAKPKTQAGLQAKLQAKSMNSVSTQIAAAPAVNFAPIASSASLASFTPPATSAPVVNPVPPATSASPANFAPPADSSLTDPATPVLPIASLAIFEPAAPVVQISSTVSEASYTTSTSTSDRAIAYQYHSSNERPAETVAINRAGRDAQKDPQNISDLAPAVTVPIPATIAAEPQPPLPLPTGSNTPRLDIKADAKADAKASGSASAIPQDSSASSGSDPKTILPSELERANDPNTAANSGALAFAARLTPATELQPAAAESTRPAEPQPSSQIPLQPATPVTAKQIETGADLPADPHGGESGAPPDREKASDAFTRPDTLLPQIHTAVADQTAIPANSQASATPLPLAAHMDQIVAPPAAPPNSNHDITVRIPDATGQDTAVRFVERAGEIHVSVRTGDVEMAQSLRGGLNDLVNHLEDGGIRTEVWQPGSGSNSTSSQNDSHQPFADPDGSNGRNYPSGSNSEQESRQQNKPRWVEELEGSIGNPNSKEIPQLWQA